MCRLKISGIIRESIVDGPGIRFVVFAQGCPHHCEGCHNPQTWPFDGGKDVTVQKIMDEIKKNPLISGITLSGGEPFCQPEGMAALASAARGQGINVIAYTGYLFERLLEMSKAEPNVMEFLKQVDVLVDGPFITALKSYELKFKGSSNQRAIDVKKSLEQNTVVLAWDDACGGQFAPLRGGSSR
jgi:anaerobic ribonucleoside-triphosphate reductase activating protein